jgi:hypothetical protein
MATCRPIQGDSTKTASVHAYWQDKTKSGAGSRFEVRRTSWNKSTCILTLFREVPARAGLPLHLNFDYDWERLRSSPNSRTHRYDVISKLMSAFVRPQQPNCRPGSSLCAGCAMLAPPTGSRTEQLYIFLPADHPRYHDADWRRIVLSNHLRDEFPSERCQDADSRRR